jgi:hypothetical protein
MEFVEPAKANGLPEYPLRWGVVNSEIRHHWKCGFCGALHRAHTNAAPNNAIE